MFDFTRLSHWGLAFALSVTTLGIAPAITRAQNTPVYIDDSPAAMDQLTEAIRLRSQNRLTESVTKYQYILETYRHKLMQSDKPYHTDTRRLVVGRLLADEPLLSTYRKQYEPAAKRLLLQAADSSNRLEALLAVVDRYYLCPSGMVAGLDAAGLLLEQADFPAATALLEQLTQHPDRKTLTKRYDALLSACHVLDDPYQRVVDPDMLKYVGISQAQLQPPMRSPLSRIGQSGWTIPGLPTDTTQIWSIELNNPFATEDGGTAQRRRVFRRQRDQAEQSPLDGNLVPLIHADMLLVNSQQGIGAYDRLSGRPLWQYKLTNDTNTNAMNSAPLDQQRSVCVAENRVIGVVGFMTQWRATWRLKNHQTHLVCLDMKTGALLWDTQPEVLDDSLEEVFFHGTPLADDRRVYVLMRRSQNSGFHTVYLAALDITDGHMLWKRHLASAAMSSNNRFYALGEMTLYQGQIYVTDNLGTVSAVDGLTGDMLWLYMLDRNPDSQDIEPKPLVAPRRVRMTASASRPAPIVTSSKVLIAPAWANEPAQVLDRLSGNPIRKLSDPGFDTSCQLAITHAGLLSVGKTVQLFNADSFEGKWQTKIEGLNDDEKTQFLVHGDQVMIQAADQMITLNLADGSVVSKVPFDQDGVVLTSQDQWVISQGRQITSLMRWEDAYNQLVARIDRYPNQAWPGLALSHIAAMRQQWSIVLQGIDAAIDATNIAPAMPINSSQQQQVQQVFDHIREQVELPADGVKDPQLAQAKLKAMPDHMTMMSLFERLAMVSMTPANEVTQQFARGRYWQYRGQPGSAIEHYQSVLADPTLAAQLYQFDQGARQARLEARLRLTEIVTTDPATMARFEAVADEHLHQLQQMNTTTAAGYLALAESYPLTQASASARMTAASQYWQQGQIDQAVVQLQQAYHQANAQALKQQIAGKLAQGYEQLGDASRAHRVLNNFALLFPNVPVWRDGREVSVAAWISELAHSHPLQTRYPSYPLPLGQAVGLTGRLMLPTHHMPDVHTLDLVMLRNDNLSLYRLDQRKVIWSLPLEDGQTQLLAQSSDELLLWQPTLNQLVGLNIRTGQQLWEPVALTDAVQSVAQQPNRLAMEPDVQRQWMQMMNPQGLMVVEGRIREAKNEVDLTLRMAVSANILIAADGTGRVLAIDRHTGIVLWKRLYALDMLEQLAVHDQFLAIGGSVGLPNDTQSHRMLVVDLPTGEPVMHPMEGKDRLRWLGIVSPDLLISITDELIAAHRIGTGEVVWRLPNPGTPMVQDNDPVTSAGSLGIAPLPHAMLFKDTQGTYTSIDLTTGQTTGAWLANGGETAAQPQMRLADDRYFLLTPTQLTSTDLAGNLLWHDAINTTTQYLLAMQLGDQYLVLLTRRDQGWANQDAPDAAIDQPIHGPELPPMPAQQAVAPDRRMNPIEAAPFNDVVDGQYRYQILLLDRTTGRIVNEQSLAPMPSPLLPTVTLLCDNNLILSTANQTIIIPAGKE
jgi:outer membrane protein assembly factor BamB